MVEEVYHSSGTIYHQGFHGPCTRIQGNSLLEQHQAAAASVGDELCSKFRAVKTPIIKTDQIVVYSTIFNHFFWVSYGSQLEKHTTTSLSLSLLHYM